MFSGLKVLKSNSVISLSFKREISYARFVVSVFFVSGVLIGVRSSR